MTSQDTRRMVMTMFSDPECISCHRVRLVIAEKGIECNIEPVDANSGHAELAQINPLNSLPTLMDRDLTLYDARVIIDYLDERYPHPPFMPVDPVSRAKTRLAAYRIESDWYALLPALEQGGESAVKAARELTESLVASADVFAAMPYFLSEEYSVLDAALAPLLWRLPHYGIVLPEAAGPVSSYARRLFARDGFQASLTERERELRQ